MLTNLKKYNIILGSNSPRRKTLLAGLDIDFEVRTISNIDESYPDTLSEEEVPLYIAGNKAAAFLPFIRENELLITADTVVVVDSQIVGKPANKADAIHILRLLSGRTHRVITGVHLNTKEKSSHFSVVSTVSFAQLDSEEINYYVDKYQPYDKAGAYGIQEWIGYIGVESIEGSFYNVMGLPVQRLYRELQRF
ncbi:MAG: Maf-like protein [Massilibacteroides sp.]|nr:Maf-like protein [Massilibacteroides sp.]MDD3061682.1 Maf-like protein [Massilibacteroides sp.]MDD4114400.1 Maf-like protein [Massilibacteroides sp.]MDD4660273.1 Maf-like protein [Massilibacteroides sp.]